MNLVIVRRRTRSVFILDSKSNEFRINFRIFEVPLFSENQNFRTTEFFFYKIYLVRRCGCNFDERTNTKTFLERNHCRKSIQNMVLISRFALPLLFITYIYPLERIYFFVCDPRSQININANVYTIHRASRSIISSNILSSSFQILNMFALLD